jgi:hypothetical protein
MPIYQIAHYEVRAGARDDAERAMHALAATIRTAHPDASWTAYRDPRAPSRYLAILRGDDAAAAQAFADALRPYLAGALDLARYDLVTSSDLARRTPPSRGRRRQ